MDCRHIQLETFDPSFQSRHVSSSPQSTLLHHQVVIHLLISLSCSFIFKVNLCAAPYGFSGQVKCYCVCVCVCEDRREEASVFTGKIKLDYS